jgi:hypothetical protein
MSGTRETYEGEAADMASLHQSLRVMLGALINSANALKAEPAKVEALLDLMAENLADLIREACRGAVAAHVAMAEAAAGLGGTPQ